MKPTGDSRKAYEQGAKAASEGRSLEDNPYRRMSRQRLSWSAWWEAGYINARREQ